MVPESVIVVAQTQAICRDHEAFDRADKFKSGRLAEYRDQSHAWRPSTFSCLPCGPRVCIGKRLANLNLYTCCTNTA